jgi:hypothetical protein
MGRVHEWLRPGKTYSPKSQSGADIHAPMSKSRAVKALFIDGPLCRKAVGLARTRLPLFGKHQGTRVVSAM